ncbi:helix-turn-helix domain-containing protein [Halorarius litoreus]|uniref:helix-turn-helix domain-containing protein n=1 Tax=Halorarius litoreus TaxID=2962676 RepID=UPI0020CE1B9F|nr:helix-turn-helix domain-containing protein [Halorarius litoreus]
MPRATLSVDVPPETWVHAVSTTNPDAGLRVQTALADETRGVVLVEVVADRPVAVVAAIERADAVRHLDLLWSGDGATLVQLETVRLPLLAAVLDAGVPLSFPFTVRDGTATWALTTAADRLSALGDRLDAAGIDYRLDHLADVDTTVSDRLLTARQRELLRLAAAAGYYESPRRATLSEVADRAGIAKSTASDVLHRAEGAVVSWFLDQFDGTVTDARWP